MNPYASVVTYSVDALFADQLEQAVAEHVIPAAQSLPGYLGFLLLDQGDGKRMAIVLFDSIEAAQAAPKALTPVGQQHTYHLMSSPAIGSICQVLLSDGSLA